MTTKVIKTEVIKEVKGIGGMWEIEKTTEQKYDCFDEKKGKPETFYDCVFENTIYECFKTLKEAVIYCKTH